MAGRQPKPWAPFGSPHGEAAKRPWSTVCIRKTIIIRTTRAPEVKLGQV